MTELEQLILQENQLMLLYTQDSLIEEIEKLVNEFNDRLLHLRHEKILLDVTIKLSELKYVITYTYLKCKCIFSHIVYMYM